jgi:TonB-dependent starch-binding outer membrane protein SusC
MKKIFVLFAILVLAGGILHAQERRVSGTVTDAADGSSLPGVTVMVKGTTMGTVTDLDGQYELRVTPDATLVFSFIGMVTREVVVGNQTVINIALEVDIATLQETVVVGYGVQQRRDISGAISSVSGDAIRTIPIQSFDQALQGKAAGVSLTLPNAVLGNPPVIRVRGVNSISGSSSPLYIVDGVPVFSGEIGRTAAAVNPLGDISPSDIESIEVLKDASATAIYGSRAANGVILITTRRGQEGDMRVSYDVNTGWSQTHRFYDLMNAEQYVFTKNTARANADFSDAYFLAYDQDGTLINTD